MIFVDRSRIKAPAFFSSVERERLLSNVLAFDDRDAKLKRQSRASLDMAPLRASGLRASLFELFRGRCAYCEQAIPSEMAEFDHFRPKLLYPWLAYNWDNLYLCCRVCNRNKAGEFPLRDETTRARAPGDDLSAESRLLLDPCVDDPVTELVFLADGTVTPRRDDARAHATIKLLGLNRSELVGLRHGVAAQVPGANIQALRALQSDNRPFQALVGDMIRAHHIPGMLAALGVSALPEENVPVQPDNTTLPRRTARIVRVEIRNFRAIEHLTLKPVQWPSEPVLDTDGGAASTLVGWTTFLGENGVGKSSVLQAIALALAGPASRDCSWLEGRRFLRRGAGQGSVKLELSDGDTLAVRLGRRGNLVDVSFEPGEPHELFVRAYGATRLPARAGVSPDLKPDPVQVGNLFDPWVPLVDAQRWLAALDESSFDLAARTLKDLLCLPKDGVVELRDGELVVDGEPLETLSDGYRTLVALACDIIAGLPDGIADLQAATGIILLDEMGTHLHPSWKMRIVGRLRRAFPLLQWLVSTHEPLCLRGLSQGEVVKLRRIPGSPREDGTSLRVVALDTDLPSPAGLRVDQLLTSSHFGLDSTIDPRIDEQFQHYYTLLAIQDRDEGQEQERIRLSQLLQRYGVLGYTRRDQLVYECIDRFIAEERDRAHTLRPKEGDDEALRTRKQQVMARVAELWRFAEVNGDGK